MPKKKQAVAKDNFIPCSGPKRLPDHLLVPAALAAIRENPVNRSPIERVFGVLESLGIEVPSAGEEPILKPEHIAVMTTKYFRTGGVKLTVAFMEPINAALRDKIISHMNAWGTRCNVAFTYSKTDPQVRISRGGGGYWSYLGTDVLHIPRNEQTMNLEAFTEKTPDSEFYRVIRHETGHTLGCPHEHMRQEIVAKLDPQKTIAYFEADQGWSAQEIMEQVLTPLDQKSIRGTPNADDTSIMCYQLPASITRDGQPIRGGNDINELDYTFMASIYPKAGGPVTPPPTGGSVVEDILLTAKGVTTGKDYGSLTIKNS